MTRTHESILRPSIVAAMTSSRQLLVTDTVHVISEFYIHVYGAHQTVKLD